MPIDDPDVLLKDPEMSRDFLNHVLGTTPDTDPKPADAKHLEGEDVIIHGLKGRPELNEARVIKVRAGITLARVRGNLGAACAVGEPCQGSGHARGQVVRKRIRPPP